MTLTPEHTFTRKEVRNMWSKHISNIDPVEEIKDWSIEELAEEAQNPSTYELKDEYLRAIAHHHKSSHVLIQLALASNEDLPSDLVNLLIKVSLYTSVIETLIAVHITDEKIVRRAREAIDSIHALGSHGITPSVIYTQ